jgi:hypothetical protein
VSQPGWKRNREEEEDEEEDEEEEGCIAYLGIDISPVADGSAYGRDIGRKAGRHQRILPASGHHDTGRRRISGLSNRDFGRSRCHTSGRVGFAMEDDEGVNFSDQRLFAQKKGKGYGIKIEKKKRKINDEHSRARRLL